MVGGDSAVLFSHHGRNHATDSGPLQYGLNRWVNIIGGVITILWVVGGGSWTIPTYIFIASIEVVCALFIIGYAWRWRNAEAQP